MIEYQCTLMNPEVELERVPDRDEVAARFHFELTPVESVGRADERQHREEEWVWVRITAPTISTWDLPGKQHHVRRTLYWAAIERGLKEHSHEVALSVEDEPGCPIDPNLAGLPTAEPFRIARRVKMGFTPRGEAPG